MSDPVDVTSLAYTTSPTSDIDASWPDILGTLLAGRDLPRQMTAWAMDTVMSGQATHAQIAAFAVALRAKGETADEVVGLVSSMLHHAVPVTVSGPTLDIVGTGGDRSNTVNISTMSAVLATACGARVVKHGNRAATSQCGSADVLEQLGIALELGPQAVAACVTDVGIGFCFAPVFHGAMRHAAAPRKEIGIPTVFNILGPLANPARPSAALIGCADARLAPVMAAAMHTLGVSAIVVRGADGLDEVSAGAVTQYWSATGAQVISGEFDVRDMGLPAASVADLRGGEAAFNADIARRLLAGERGGALDAVRSSVIANTATALVAWEQATGAHPADADLGHQVARQIEHVTHVLDSGAAAGVLTAWASVSQQHAAVQGIPR